MASILKEIRRHCLEWGKKKGTCIGCPFHRMTNCLLRKVPAEWDLDTIQKEFRYIKEMKKD